MSTPLPPHPGCRYRPREVFRSALWRILADHLNVFLRQYESRFEAKLGPLPPESEKVLTRLACCGDPNEGVTLLRCKECEVTLAVPFSCKTRICPSCANRRAEDVADKLAGLLPEVPYRHLVFTLPKKMGIRTRFRQDRSLFRTTARLVTRLLTRWMREQLSIQQDLKRAHPGILLAQQSFGDEIKLHPHYHVLTTAGLFLPDGSFYSVSDFDQAELTARLRRSVLASLVKRNLLTPENAARMQVWPLERCGFNVYAGPVIQGDDRSRLRDLVRYLLRAPFSLKRLDYEEVSGRVSYRASNGQVKTWSHALEFLACLVQHIPKSRQQTVSSHGWFANPTGHLSSPKPDKQPDHEPSPKRGRWAARVLRVWQVDPELCPRCGKLMRRSRAVFERLELIRLLKALGRFGYPARPPPCPPEPLEPEASHHDPSPDECSQVPGDWDEVSQLPLDW